MFTKPTTTTEVLNTRMQHFCRRSDYTHDKEIGIELELEGFGAESMGYSPDLSYFVAHRDPSLRGDCVELVLRRPVTRREFHNKVIPEFIKLKEGSRFKPSLSHRCSYHVHLDFSHKTLYTFIKFATLYACFEQFFFEKAGAERKGNHFCLRLYEADKYVRDLVSAIQRQDFSFTANENLRYMAFNLQALFKFGSVEIRLHEGTADEVRIAQWVDVLLELVDFAQDNFDMKPEDIIFSISAETFEGFTRKYLPKTWGFIADIYHNVGVRMAVDVSQDLAFSLDWGNAPTHPAPMLKEDKKPAKKLQREDYVNALNAAQLALTAGHPLPRGFVITQTPEPVWTDTDENGRPF